MSESAHEANGIKFNDFSFLPDSFSDSSTSSSTDGRVDEPRYERFSTEVAVSCVCDALPAIQIIRKQILMSIQEKLAKYLNDKRKF